MPTQKQLIVDHINQMGYITSAEAYTLYGITQLATRIKELKAKGYVFSTENQKTINRFGKTTHYVKYKIESEPQCE